MTGCPSYETLLDWAEGLDAPEAAAHRPEACAACARRLADHRRMTGALAALGAVALADEAPPAAHPLPAPPPALAACEGLLRESRARQRVDWARSRDLAAEALATLERTEPEWGATRAGASHGAAVRADAWGLFGLAESRLNRVEEGIAWMERALDFWTRRADPLAAGNQHANLAIAGMLRRDLEGAERHARAALACHAAIDQRRERTNAQQVLGIILSDLRRDGESRAALTAAEASFREDGRMPEAAMTMQALAQLDLRAGRTDEAAATMRRAIPILREADHLDDATRCESFLGHLETLDPATFDAGIARLTAAREHFAARGLWLDAIFGGLRELRALLDHDRLAAARALLERLRELAPADRDNAWLRDDLAACAGELEAGAGDLIPRVEAIQARLSGGGAPRRK